MKNQTNEQLENKQPPDQPSQAEQEDREFGLPENQRGGNRPGSTGEAKDDHDEQEVEQEDKKAEEFDGLVKRH